MSNEEMNSIKEKVSEYILEHISESDLDYDLRIFEEGLVNSLFAIELMTFIEKTFEIKVNLEDLDMENFQTVNVIAKFVSKKLDGGMND